MTGVQTYALPIYAADQALWRDWYRFTRELATTSAFSENQQERALARTFITRALESQSNGESQSDTNTERESQGQSAHLAGRRPADAGDVFQSASTCTAALAALTPNPDHMFWFEYNFLFVLAAGGRSDKASLGDHTPAGYQQRARFYAISPEGQLLYAKNVALYLCFLAETTGQSTALTCHTARQRLQHLETYAQLLADIAPTAD